MEIIQGVHPLPNDPGPVLQNMVSFTPGRVNLIGEHTDYNGGMVMPAALDLGLRAHLKVLGGQESGIFVASRTANQTLSLTPQDVNTIAHKLISTGVERSDAVSLSGLKGHHWARYVIGCFAMFEATLRSRHQQQMPWDNRTISMIIDSNLPQGAGLSSSAALCISILGQLNALAALPLDASTLARIAMYVEHRFAATKCGLMDQLAVLCSRADHFTRIDFLEFPVSHNFHLSYSKAHETFRDHALVIFKTGVNHSLADSAYNERRASCEAALAGLNKKLGLGAHSLGELARLPRFQTIPSESEYLTQLESLLEGEKDSKILARRACHAMLENTRVMNASRALSTGNIQLLNAAMRASHTSLDEHYEVTCPELNTACSAMESVIRDLCKAQPSSAINALIGPRMTGGGFGGSTVQLVHRRLCEPVLEAFANSKNPYTNATGIVPEIFISRPSAGFSAGLEPIE